MRGWRKAALWTLVLGSAWTGVEIQQSGGLRSFLAADARGSELSERLRRFRVFRPGFDRRLVYLGDSNCMAQERGGLGVPRLDDLLDAGIREGRLGPGWSFLAECWPGHNGYDFERQAAELLASGPVPRAVLIPVSLRSLNAAGNNGFIPNRRGLRLWDRPGSWEVAWKFPAAFIRAWWIWNVRFLADSVGSDDFYQYPVPPLRKSRWPLARTPAPPKRPPPAVPVDKDLAFQIIYGAGFRMNLDLLNALVQTGWHLKEDGVAAFFVVSPAAVDELGRRWGPASRGQVEDEDRRLVGLMRDQGFAVLDLHAEDQGDFYEAPAEHLDGAGRKAVAERLLRWMAESLNPGGAEKTDR